MRSWADGFSAPDRGGRGRFDLLIFQFFRGDMFHLGRSGGGLISAGSGSRIYNFTLSLSRLYIFKKKLKKVAFFLDFNLKFCLFGCIL